MISAPLLAALVVIHAVISATDPGGHALRIVHEPFPGMPMRMEMTTYEPSVRDGRAHPGTHVRLRCDVATTPWVCSDVRIERPRAQALSGPALAGGSAFGLPVRP